MAYVGGYVVPVKTARLADYRDMATKAAAIWKSLGALSVVEAQADNAPMGEVTSFPRAVLLQEDETVVFSYMTFNDRAHYDAVMAAGMQHATLMGMMQDSGFDGKRMIFGGFEVIVSV